MEADKEGSDDDHIGRCGNKIHGGQHINHNEVYATSAKQHESIATEATFQDVSFEFNFTQLTITSFFHQLRLDGDIEQLVIEQKLGFSLFL